MLLPISIIGFLWFIFLAYWLISSFNVKKTVRRSWWYSMGIRIVFVAVVFWIAQSPTWSRLYAVGNFSQSNSIVAYAGVLLCALGIAFAIWARAHLGRNWGMPMSVRENPDLITSGPYRFVRNPIYTGFLAAMLGSALVVSKLWIFLFLTFAIYFIFSAFQEEKLMARLFPDQYPAYRKKTKILIPFIW